MGSAFLLFLAEKKKGLMLKGLCRADFEDAQEPAGQKGFGSPPRQCHCLLLSDTVCRLSDFSPCALDV